MQNNEVKKNIKASKIFERGAGDWDKLFEFMDSNDFTCADFLACVCASILNYPQTQTGEAFKTELMIQGIRFKIEIKPEKF